MIIKKKHKNSKNDLSIPQNLRFRMFIKLFNRSNKFSVLTENFARFMGTPKFLLYMTIFCSLWLGWNTFAPENLQFDSKNLNYTLLTLMLSLQASYAAPLLLLAQNKQDTRDRVSLESDRQQAARNLADTEYLIRELVALRLTLREMATKDYIKSEMKTLFEEIMNQIYKNKIVKNYEK